MSDQASSGPPNPIVPVTTDQGVRWGLDQREFDRWWKALPVEDYETFVYYNGDELLMRFVCAYDWLARNDDRIEPGKIVEAYAIAALLDPAGTEARARAGRAWKHPAVVELLARLHYRDMERARHRLERRYTKVLENLAIEVEKEGTTIADKAAVANAFRGFMALMDRTDTELRKFRLKEAKSMRAAIEHTEQRRQSDIPTDAELPILLAQLAQKFGKDAIRKMIDTAAE